MNLLKKCGAEFIGAFAIVFGGCGAVATDYRATGQAAGLAIGGTVWFEAMFAGPLCGASMNPARSLGPALVSGDWTHFSAYVFGPILGATAGAFFYEFIRCHSEPGTDAKGCC